MDCDGVLSSLSQISKDIRRENKSLRNRLQSIYLDHNFLTNEVIPYFPNYPIIPNERCGLWYCDPKTYTQTSYFKSTDGHTGQWDFSTRRLNFHLLNTLKEHGGIIIVDSTRRGKRIPDAQSKTIPIWCAVLNTLMATAVGTKFKPEETLYVPPEAVSKSEYELILERLPDFVRKLSELDIVNGRQLYEMLGGRFLRPFWVYPGSPILQASTDIFTGQHDGSHWEVSEDENIIPVILCTVSYQAQDGLDKQFGFSYVQGAADDHELWSNGLTPTVFWSNVDQLTDRSKTDEELVAITKRLLSEDSTNTNGSRLEEILISTDKITPELVLGKMLDNSVLNNELCFQLSKQYSLVIILSDTIKVDKGFTISGEGSVSGDQALIKVYPLQSQTKKGSRELRAKLPEILNEVSNTLRKGCALPILICCNSGTDLSIGVLLAVLSRHYSQNWSLLPVEDAISNPPIATKTTIRKHLTQIIAHLGGRNINPSRATLNSVNSFLM